MKKTSAIAASLLYLSAVAVHAQQTTGHLEGRVVDGNDQPLADVNVVVNGPAIQGVRGGVTDEGGSFRILALPSGAVNVTFRHIAYQHLVVSDVKILLGKTISLGDIVLTSRSIDVDAIEITAARPVIDVTSTTIGANLSSVDFETLPTERDYLSIVTLLPQANASFLGDDVNIGGATGQENAYFIDGANTTDPFRAIGSTQLPYNFVKEIELKTGGYEAEFGRATGGIVNVVTHSGSNEFQAKAFGFYTNNDLASDSRRGFVDLTTGDFLRYDLGLSLGGPVARDRLWYFLAYNGRFDQEDVTLAGIGVRPDDKRTHMFAGKLTWQPSSALNLMLSIFGDPISWDRIGHNLAGGRNPTSLANPDPFLGQWQQGTLNGTLHANYVASDRFLVEGKVSRYRGTWIAEAATERGRIEPLFRDGTTGVWSGGYGAEFDRLNTRNSLSLSTTYFAGAHHMKGGFQFEDNLFDEDWRWQSQGPDGAGIIGKNSENNYIVLPLDFQSRDRNRVISLFAQGSFAVARRLRLNAGLRWDGQYFKGLDNDLGTRITDQYQPRLGFVYQIGELGTQKISASVARFYEQVPLQMISLRFGNLSQDIILYDHNPLEYPSGGMLFPFIRPGTGITEPNLQGEHFDEITLGYERQIARHYKLGVRGIYRTVREIIQNSSNPETGANQEILGNPGRGILHHMPRPQRDYAALEVTFAKLGGGRFNFFTSYVMSRTYGNYTGLFSSDTGLELPNAGTQFDNPEQLINATGPLPNDRTHVFKFNGAYRFDFGLDAGAALTWQSGTPLNDIGAHPSDIFSYVFLQERGSVGRAPAIWDLNLRLTYRPGRLLDSKLQSRVFVDILHAFSQREPVNFEQRHFFAVDPATGEQITENPNYLRPVAFQPPMTVRLGVEVGL